MAAGTADRIAEQAMAILRVEGAEAVSMRRVAQAAGVTAMAIYRHFPSRDALLAEVAARARARFDQHWRTRPRRENPRTELRAVLNALLDFALAEPRLYALLFTGPRPGGELGGGCGAGSLTDFRSDDSAAMQAVVAAIDEGMHQDEFEADDVWEVALSVVALLHGLVTMHHAGRLGLSDPEFRVLCGTAMTRLLQGVGPSTRGTRGVPESAGRAALARG